MTITEELNSPLAHTSLPTTGTQIAWINEAFVFI